MPSADAMTVARNGGFQERVKYFLQKAALAVMAEVNTTAAHAARVVYAKVVLTGDASVPEAAVAVVTNATVAAAGFNVTDNDLEFTVNSVFNALAGVST